MKLFLATSLLAAMMVGSACAGEIILVDPISGTTRSATTEKVMAPGETQTDAERARERVGTADGEGSSSILVLPRTPDPLTSHRDGKDVTTGEAARRASDRANAYVPDSDETQTGIDRKSIVIIDDGKAIVIKEGERVDNKTRNTVDILKARAYRKDAKPCGGSIIIGGIGETGTPTSSGTSYSKDVNVISNCR